MEKYIADLKDLLLEYIPSVISATFILVAGLFLIGIVTKSSKRIMANRGVDITLQKFLGNLGSWILKILLFITVISQLGITTTSFAAIIAAGGLAVGLALQGSLANFAGGVLIMIFKPIKIGDFIEAQGQSGTVKEIEIFTTKLNTTDNKEIIIPNGALSNGNIVNYSTEATRRVDFKEPAIAVNLSELGDSSINFFTRGWVKKEDYWTVKFDVMEQVKEALDTAGIDIPYPHRVNINK